MNNVISSAIWLLFWLSLSLSPAGHTSWLVWNVCFFSHIDIKSMEIIGTEIHLFAPSKLIPFFEFGKINCIWL